MGHIKSRGWMRLLPFLAVLGSFALPHLAHAQSQYQTCSFSDPTTCYGIGPGVAGQAYVSNGNAYPSFSSSLSDVNSVFGVTVPGTSSYFVTGPTTTTPSLCFISTTTAGLGSWGSCSGGSGGVTTVSVVTANGLSGTVANPTTTPAITLAPTFTGWVYSNGSGFAAATLTGDCSFTLEAITCLDSNGVPIVTTTGTQTLTNKSIAGSEINSGTVGATYGGTGLSSYAIGDILYASTTTALDPLAPGPSGYVLTSNGSGAAPSWNAAGGSTAFQANGTPLSSSTTVNFESGNGIVVSNPSAGNVLIGPTNPSRTVTLSTDTILSTDIAGTVAYNSSSAVAVALPAANATGFGPGATVYLVNINTGTATVTPAASVDGHATIAIPGSSGCGFWEDATPTWHIDYTSCPALTSGGSPAFSAVTTGTNTTATMTAGTGATITVSGSGVNNANELNGAAPATSAAVAATNSSGQVVAASTVTYLIDTGTTFTISSGTGTCATTSTLTGGTAVGSVKCTGTSGASTVVVTLPTAPHGWVCEGNDLTTTTDSVHQTASSTTSCTLSGTLVANDVINFMAAGF